MPHNSGLCSHKIHNIYIKYTKSWSTVVPLITSQCYEGLHIMSDVPLCQGTGSSLLVLLVSTHVQDISDATGDKLSMLCTAADKWNSRQLRHQTCHHRNVPVLVTGFSCQTAVKHRLPSKISQTTDCLVPTTH